MGVLGSSGCALSAPIHLVVDDVLSEILTTSSEILCLSLKTLMSRISKISMLLRPCDNVGIFDVI